MPPGGAIGVVKLCFPLYYQKWQRYIGLDLGRGTLKCDERAYEIRSKLKKKVKIFKGKNCKKIFLT